MSKTNFNIPKLEMITGREIPKLGLGTWTIGGAKERNPNNDNKAQIAGVRYAIERGVTLIDTAANYAEGYCETLLAKAFKGYDRDKLFITSRVGSTNATKKGIIKSIQESLKRLQIEQLDLFLVGAINPDVSIEETAEAFLEILDKGYTRDIGVANYRLPELKKLQKLTENQIVLNQFHYNLIIREAELTGLLEYCQSQGIIFETFRPIQQGQLSKPGIAILDQIAGKYNKTQTQIALKWLLEKEGVVPITKSINPKHIDENFDLFDWEIEQDDLEKLSTEFPIQIRISDVSPPKTMDAVRKTAYKKLI